MNNNNQGIHARSALLANVLARTDQDFLARHLKTQRWEPGAVGLSSNRGNHGLYCVQHGRLELVVNDPSGHERTLRLLSEADIFGLECLHPQPHPGGYQVRAITVSSVLAIAPELVDHWIGSFAEFRQALARSLASGIWNMEREREHTLSQPVAERLVCYLRCGEDCRGTQGCPPLHRAPLPMQVLARRIGCSAGHLSRATRRLLQEGVVQRVHGGLQLGDVSRFPGMLCEGCSGH